MVRVARIREECVDDYRTISSVRPLLHRVFEVKEGRMQYGQKTYIHRGMTFYEDDLELEDELDDEVNRRMGTWCQN